MSYGFPESSYDSQRPFTGQGQMPVSQQSTGPRALFPPQHQQYTSNQPSNFYQSLPYGYPPQQNHGGRPAPYACYNCGSGMHWAQHCPEPRRPVPAGSTNQPYGRRPNKRQKPNAPVITRYALPPNVASQYPPRPGQFGPPQQPHNQWPQGGHQYAQQSYPYGTYGNSGYSPPIPHYGPPFGPSVPPGGYMSPTNYTPAPAQYQHPSSPQHSGFSDISQRRPSLHGPPSPWQHQVSPRSFDQTSERHSQWSPPFHSQGSERRTSLARSSEEGQQSPYDDDSDSLEILDFSIENFPGPTAVLTSRPLLADPTAKEAFEPLPSVPYCEGTSVSRYFNDANFSELFRSIRDTAYWSEFQDDPVFRQIDDSCNMVPLSVLQGAHSYGVSSEQTEANNTELPNGGLPASDSGNNGERVEQQRGLNGSEQCSDVDASSSWAHKGEFSFGSSEDNGMRRSPERDTTEDILARLGVTGAPKPVVKTALISRSERRSVWKGNGSNGHQRRERSKSPTTQDRSDHRDRSPVRQIHDIQSIRDGLSSISHTTSGLATNEAFHPRHDESQPSGHGSNTGRDHDSIDPQRRGQPLAQPSSADDEHNGLRSDAKSQDDSGGEHRAPNDAPSKTDSRNDRISRRRSASPRRQSEDQSKDRRGGYRQRKIDGHKRAEPLRQVDDVTPKLKRHQPKVAEAYSRRW